MQKPIILAIDDEEHILELIKYNLEASGFEVKTATTVKSAFEQLEKNHFDGILLDIMLPDMDGMTALKKIRGNESTQDIPVLMVTAKAEEIDKIIGLELGADDYITKPFSVRELVARVHAVIRRNRRDKVQVQEEEVKVNALSYEKLVVDKESHKVFYGGEEIELTYKEFELLKLLMSNKEKVFTREMLLDQIWGYDYYGETRTVDVHIRYLRSKLQPYELDHAIETVRGVGYRFAKER
ncbi:MAG: response regulator [Cellulosilyticaceae bacterium]